MRRFQAAACAAIATLLWVGCGHDWDPLDPRLAGAGGSVNGPGGAGPGGAGPGGAGPGGAGGAGVGGSGSGGSPVAAFSYRRSISISASSTLAVGHTVTVTFDHAQLVTAGKSLANGADVRVFREDAGSSAELPRVASDFHGWDRAQTIIAFALPEPAPGGTPPSSYYLYYGAPDAMPSDGDPTQIYLAYDDFEDGSLDPAWSADQIGTAFTWTHSEANGVLHIEGGGGTLGGSADSVAFISRPLTGDFVALVQLRAATPESTGFAALGALSVRQNLAPGSRHFGMVRESAPLTYSRLHRATDGASNSTTSATAGKETVSVGRSGNAMSAFAAASDDTLVPVGTPVAIVTNDPVLTGIPFADGGVTSSSVDVELFLAVALPVPDTTLGAEETGTFMP